MSKRLALTQVLKRTGGIVNPSMMSGCVVPKSAIFASRLRSSNKYAYDYACEDEYFEREMTLLDAKNATLPISNSFRHKSFAK